MEINLLPWRNEIIAINKKLFMQLMMIVVVLAALFLFVASRFFFAANAYSKSYIETLEQAKITLVRNISGYLNDKKIHQELAARVVTLRQLRASRFYTVRLLNVFTKITPHGVFFTKLTRNGNVVDLSGNANSNLLIAQFMKLVDASPELDVISLQKVEKTEGANTIVTRFDLKVILTMSDNELNAEKQKKKIEIANPVQSIKELRDEKDRKIENILKTGSINSVKPKSQ